MNKSACDKYHAAARDHGVASREGDSKAANKAYIKLVAAIRAMRAEPDQGEAALLEMLDDSDPFVVCWGATHLLPIQESVAKGALLALADSEIGLAAFNAGVVLREWSAGRLKVD
jgi:hypothetical protein